MEKLLKIKKNLFLIGILLIAAFLRLYRIDEYMTFLGDEGRDVLVVYNILHGHFTLLGPTASVGGFFLGPIYYYFMAPFLWLFNYNPVGPAVMIALLGVATVWLVWKVTKEFFGIIPAFVAGVLYAIAPLIITYSRSSWNPNPMPFFTLLCLYLLYKAVRDTNNKLFIVVGLLFGIMMQLHYLATFVGVIIAVYVVTSRIIASRMGKKFRQAGQIIIRLGIDVLTFVTGFVIGFSPFLAFEVRHGFANIRSILDFVFHSKDTGGSPQFFLTIADVGFRIFGRIVAFYPTIDRKDFYSAEVMVLWLWFGVLISMVSIGILLYQLTRTKQSYEQILQKVLLVVWLGVGVCLFGFYKKAIYDYYLGFLFPLPYLLIGNAFYFLWRRQAIFKILTVVAIGIIMVISIVHETLWIVPNRQMYQMQDISRFILEKTNNKPFNFALITGGNSDHAYRYFFTTWEHPPVRIENTMVDPQRKTVTDQLFIVCESLPCSPLGHSLFEIAGFGRAEITGHWPISVVEVYRLVHYKSK